MGELTDRNCTDDNTVHEKNRHTRPLRYGICWYVANTSADNVAKIEAADVVHVIDDELDNLRAALNDHLTRRQRHNDWQYNDGDWLQLRSTFASMNEWMNEWINQSISDYIMKTTLRSNEVLTTERSLNQKGFQLMQERVNGWCSNDSIGSSNQKGPATVRMLQVWTRVQQDNWQHMNA